MSPSKRGNTEVMVVMVFLMLALVVITMFSRVESETQALQEAEAVAHSTIRQDLRTTATEFSYVTRDGIPIEELIGVYSCYGEEEIDYGGDLQFNVWEEIRVLLDDVYGQDKWALRIETGTEETELNLPFIYDSSGSITDSDHDEMSDLEKTANLKNLIAPSSTLIGLDDLGESDPQVTICDLNYDDTDATANEESWGRAVKYICENGPPTLTGRRIEYNGWSGDQPKVLFFISDEYSCSCQDGRDDSNPIDFTIEYVDDAIVACNAADVTVFYLKPDTILGRCDEPDAVYREGTRLAESTGGVMVDIDNAQEAANIIRSMIELPDQKILVDSHQVIEEVALPEEGEISAYYFIYPLPCDERSMGTATLYRWI